jgi:hypothetical protein
VPTGVAVAAGVHGGTGCGGDGEDIIATKVVAGQHSAEVVICQSRAVVHRFVPFPSSPFVEHYITRRAHTLSPWVKNAVGLRALRIADEHP